MNPIHKRYLALAGPFTAEERPLLLAVVTYLRRSGARITTQPERDGTTIYRLRSECETHEETAERLRRLRPDGGSRFPLS